MFPTVHFPNPEEPGAMDAALELAEQTGPDVVIANDPDADRCAVAVPGPGGWRMLRGDEVGALLGAHILARGVDDDAVFANSIVSSRLLAAMAKAAGVRHEETLTGFKWISRVEGLRYGYEEALGYCVDPPHVRDKDGVSAALVVAEMTATLKAEGRSLTDLLDDLAVEHGVHATDSFAVRVADLSLIGTVMARLRDNPPERRGRHRGLASRRPGRGQRGPAAHRRAALLPRRTTRGSSCDRPAPSPSSRSTSRSSSRSRAPRRCGSHEPPPRADWETSRQPWRASPPSDWRVPRWRQH